MMPDEQKKETQKKEKKKKLRGKEIRDECGSDTTPISRCFATNTVLLVFCSPTNKIR